jgi:hypothetical protein
MWLIWVDEAMDSPLLHANGGFMDFEGLASQPLVSFLGAFS